MTQRFFISLILFWLSSSIFAQELQLQHLKVDIKGMSCKFCVRSVEKNLSKLDDIQNVSVNLDKGIAHIIMVPGKEGNVIQIKELIRKAGFTPGDVLVVKNNKQRLDTE